MLDYPLADIIDLIRHHLDRNRRTAAANPVPAPSPSKNTQEKVIYRQADDSWF